MGFEANHYSNELQYSSSLAILVHWVKFKLSRSRYWCIKRNCLTVTILSVRYLACLTHNVYSCTYITGHCLLHAFQYPVFFLIHNMKCF